MSVFISWAEKESFSHDGALLLQNWLPDGVMRRLGNKFVLTTVELPELLKLLFPPEMAEAEEALRQALAEIK